MTDLSSTLSMQRIGRASRLLLLAAILMPDLASALGLGQLRVNSALNQRLDAEIELLAVQPGDLDALEVRLATQSLEGNINARSVEFNYRLENRDGRHYIRLFSTGPIREPLLNFLVELSWQQGRLLRELAVFLDPPSAAPRPVAAAPPPAPRRASPPSPPPAPASPQFSTEEQAGALSYGPVQRGETLWAIASRSRPGPEVSVPQMIQAIYEANPGAFARRSPDSLMAGVTLRIPAVSGQPPRQPEAPAAASAPAVAARPAPEPVAIAPEPAVVPQPEVESSAEVRLLPPEDDLADLTEDPVAEAPVRGAVIDSEAGRPSLRLAGFDDLRDRIQQMERDGLLTGRSAAVAETPAEVGLQPAEPAEPATSAAIDPESPSGDTAPESTVPTQDVAVTDVADSAVPVLADETTEPAIASETVAEETVPSPNAGMPETSTPQSGDPITVAEPPAPPRRGFDLVGLLIRLQDDPIATLSGLRSQPLALPLLGIAGGLLLLLAILLRRSRQRAERRDEAELQQALATPANTSGASARMPAEETRLQPAPLGLRSNRIDRVDFLLAAGSYREAENLVRLALVEEPDNVDLRVKILEIHHRAGNADKFVEAAGELHRRIPENSDQWQRVRAMGQALAPGQVLFEPPAARPPESTPAQRPDAGSAASAAADATIPAESEPPVRTRRREEVIEFPAAPFDRTNVPTTVPEPDEITRVAPRTDMEQKDLLQRLEALRLVDRPDAEDIDGIGSTGEFGTEATRSDLDEKLNLAAGCLDRADREGARHLIDEVLRQGSMDQQARARDMLRRMA